MSTTDDRSDGGVDTQTASESGAETVAGAPEDPDAGDRDDPEEETDPTAHLSDAPDGCGCVEVWEAASEQRERE